MTDGKQATETAGKKRHRKWHPLRWLGVILAVIILMPVLLIGAALLVVRSETGTAWIIEQVPGLTVDEGQGTLLGHWQAARLQWQGYGITLDLQQPLLDWSPSCLFRKRLCIDTVHAQTMDLETAPSSDGTEPASGFILPVVDLPLTVEIPDVRIGAFTVNGTLVWDRFQLDAGGSGANWQLERVHYQLADYAVTARGRVETRGDWPVDLEVTATLPPPRGDQWEISVNLSGSVEDLRLDGTSRGYLDAGLSGEVAALDPALPAQLRVVSDRFAALDAVPETLTFQNLVVQADGSLEQGFRTSGKATLPGTAGPVALRLSGLVTTAGADNLELVLASEEEQPGKASVRGNLSWADGFSANAELALDRFPWYSLVPDLSGPPVELNTLTANFSWADNQYQGTVKAETRGPMGEATVAASLDGDLKAVNLSEFALDTGAGSATGSGRVGFDGPVSWQAALELSDFNPGFWVPALEASLNGEVKSEGSLEETPVPRMTASWDLTGSWRSHETLATGALDTATGSWVVSGLELVVGENRISGEGTWGSELSADLTLSLLKPDQLLAGLAGELEATLSLSGSPEDPVAELAADGQALAWQDQLTIGSLAVNASLSEGQVLDASVEAGKIESAGQELETLVLNAAGTRQDHTLTVDAQHADARVTAGFEGGFGERWQSWLGSLARGEISIPEQDQRWRLQAPAELAWEPDGRVRFGAHCWTWQQSSVCAEDQLLYPRPEIAYRISRFPTGALAPLLPEMLRWQSELNAEVSYTQGDAGPTGRVFVDAGSGGFDVLVDGEWEALGYSSLTAELALQPEVANVDVRLDGDALGSFRLDLAVDPDSPDHRVEGDFSLQGLDLALAGVFTGLQEVAGEISGQGRLSGPLMKPAVTGKLALVDGRIMDPSLPVPLEDILFQVDLNGYSADLSGRIRSNDRSETTLDGSFDWSGAPRGRLAIAGSRIPLNIEPYARLEIAPDLEVTFREGDLAVTGEVAVPRGSIEIKSLPAQAVQVSEDEVIVGVEQEEPAIRSMNMDVTVRVGEDEVTFAAFGVTGNLEGTLRIGNDMDTRGTLQLVEGHYEAYGQELQLRTARLLFVGNLTQPYLEIEAIREVGSVVAGLRLSGPVQAPSTEVFSNPDMPQSDALSYLILGRAPQSRGDQGQISRAALSLGLTRASKVTGEIGQELGIRQLTLEAEGTGEQTSVVASGYLTEDLSVRYGVGIFEPITTMALRYDLGRYFYLEAASGLAASLDIFYTRDF
ncbi:MAG: translocation/assembly module TamB domain-containing protein [Pseudomonadota bacterium]|nr:translocation/assembly module TamB domain-containing protein [Pseudomonadota bacterium]